MSQMYRVEVPPRDRAGSSQGLPGFVVMVEVPDHVISAFGNPGLADLQLKVVEIAKNATWKQRVKHWNLQFPSWLSSAVKDLAIRHGIQFIERVNFGAGIQRKL